MTSGRFNKSRQLHDAKLLLLSGGLVTAQNARTHGAIHDRLKGKTFAYVDNIFG